MNVKKNQAFVQKKKVVITPGQEIARLQKMIRRLEQELSDAKRHANKLLRWREKLIASVNELNIPPGSQDPLVFNRLKRNLNR